MRCLGRYRRVVGWVGNDRISSKQPVFMRCLERGGERGLGLRKSEVNVVHTAVDVAVIPRVRAFTRSCCRGLLLSTARDLTNCVITHLSRMYGRIGVASKGVAVNAPLSVSLILEHDPDYGGPEVCVLNPLDIFGLPLGGFGHFPP